MEKIHKKLCGVMVRGGNYDLKSGHSLFIRVNRNSIQHFSFSISISKLVGLIKQKIDNSHIFEMNPVSETHLKM